MDKKKVIGFNKFVKLGSVDEATAESLYVSYIKRSFGISQDISISEAKKLYVKSRKKQRDTRTEKYNFQRKRERDIYG